MRRFAAVDLREGSATFGTWEGFELTAENRRLLYTYGPGDRRAGGRRSRRTRGCGDFGRRDSALAR